MGCSNEIALARKHRVFAVLEDTCGTLQWPNATTDLILPAGNCVVNQTPTFTDSEELKDTLDILSRFQNAMPPVEWSCPMYVRPSGTLGSNPQGSPLWESLQGSRVVSSTAELNATLSSTGTTNLLFTAQSGNMPEKGVILVELGTNGNATEYIYYGTKTVASVTATGGTFTDLTRDYSGTQSSHSTTATITLYSVFYEQDTSSPAFSLWVETDHFVQGVSGCTVSNAALSVNNEGAVTVNMSGQGMEMVWAGSDVTTASAASGASSIVVSDAKRYSVDSRIEDVTDSLNNSGGGYRVTAVNATTETLTITPVLEGAVASAATITGYLPTGTTIGSPMESKDTDFELDDTAAFIKTGEITINAPKGYITDEIGRSYPVDFIEDRREITSTLSVYFRKEDAAKFTDGYNGDEKTVFFQFGDTAGYTMDVYMKKCNIEVPTITPAAPAVELSIPIKALGTDGEDSCQIVFH